MIAPFSSTPLAWSNWKDADWDRVQHAEIPRSTRLAPRDINPYSHFVQQNVHSRVSWRSGNVWHRVSESLQGYKLKRHTPPLPIPVRSRTPGHDCRVPVAEQ
jgi:hypothetical protein